jgi:hypothetical protein
MNRSDRTHLQALDSALAKLAAAEKRTLLDLRRAGFTFRDLAQARAFQTKLRTAARAQASLVDLMSHWTTRRTA